MSVSSHRAKMQQSLFLLILMGQCCLLTCQLYKYHFINVNKSWHDAQAHCKEKYTDLVTVYDETDISRLCQSAKNQVQAAWTGLYNKPGGDKPEWTWRWSQSGVEYKENETKWDDDEPNGRNEFCVQMTDHAKGDWWDIECTRSKPFICYDEKNSSNKFVVSTMFMTWQEAQTYCRQHHTDLVSGVDQLEDLERTTKLTTGYQYWIGLFRDTWRWSDGSSSIFRPWSQGPPDNEPQNETCAAVDKDGEWKTDNCDLEKPFFCYKDNVILIKENKTWEEAIDHCRENYKDLISITDPGQQRWVQERAKNASSSHVWLGLHYTCVLDVWFWVTNERLIYQNWASDVETDDCDMSGAMETRGGHKWSKEKDVRKFNFFCSKP